jgi:gliding motility-associated-like protein
MPNPVATVSSTTTFKVTALNNEGCSSSDSMKVEVALKNKNAYQVANAFSPNSDGKNDCFGIRHWGTIALHQFSVFNRWGEKVFSTTDPSRCWDGTFKGHLLDTAGYVYIIDATTGCGNVTLKGTVMLIR